MKIAVIGSGYVGLVSAACLAELGHEVICVDNDAVRIEALNEGIVPIYESLLQELLARHQGTRLFFTTSLTEAVRASKVVFIAVGTPSSENGEPDLSYVEVLFPFIPPSGSVESWLSTALRMATMTFARIPNSCAKVLQ